VRSCYFCQPAPCSVTVAAVEAVTEMVGRGLSIDASTSAAAVSIEPEVLSCADSTGWSE